MQPAVVYLWQYVMFGLPSGGSCWSLLHLLTYSSSFQVEHRSSTRARHLTLFCAIPVASFHVRCFLSSNSAILVRRQVCRGLPLSRFPCRFHPSALLTTCPSGLLNVWPIHPQALCLISCSIRRCPICLKSSLLLIARCSSGSY